MTYSVKVTGFSPSTITEEKLTKFFSFCGKVKSIDYENGRSEAIVHFERPASVNTATMLSGSTLDESVLTITADEVSELDEGDTTQPRQGQDIEQDEKPRAGIAAEYLARGYVLSENILQRAIEIDNKRGISKRFLDYFHSLDTNLGAKAFGPEKTVSGKAQETVKSATEQARALDEQKGISKIASDYYAKAMSSPFGQKVHDFYTTTQKQVQDIHEEARRMAETHKAEEASGKQSQESKDRTG